MDISLDFKLELESRKTRDMCSAMTEDEKTELIVLMYRSEYLKNQWLKTFIFGDMNAATNGDPTPEEMDALALWSLRD